MKPQTNLSNLKKAAIAFCSVLAITATGFAASVPNLTKAETKMAIARLDQIAAHTETNLKFNAPKTDEETETAVALFNLDQLTESNLSSLQYKAPAAEDAVTGDSDYLLASEF
jgi:hypothetical protein